MRVIQINKKNGNLLNELNGKMNGTVLFYHPECSHCVALKPQWEEMKNSLPDTKENYGIYEVNGEDLKSITHPLVKTVNGFPSIYNINNGKINSFEQERNTQNMLKFVISNLSTNNQERKFAKNNLLDRKVSFFLNKNKDLMKERRVLNRSNINNSLILATR